MLRLSLTLLLLLSACFTQAEVRFAPWVSDLYYTVKNYVDSADFVGTDPGYLDLPRQGFLLHADGVVTGTHLSLDYQLPQTANGFTTLSGKLNTREAYLTTLGLSYRGWGLSYSRDFSSYGDTEWSFTTHGQRLGFEARLHKSRSLSGDLERTHDDVPAEPLVIEAHHLRQRTVLCNLYYVFNRRRFSLPAAMTQTVVQRRSAGSFLAILNYHHTSSRISDPELSFTVGQGYVPSPGQDVRSQFRRLSQSQLSIGGGYAYNYVFPSRSWLLHGSVMPMLSFWHRNRSYFDVSQFDADSQLIQASQHSEALSQQPLTFNCSYHLNLVYNHERFLCGVLGLMNIDSLPGHQRFSLYTFDWSVRCLVGYRF